MVKSHALAPVLMRIIFATLFVSPLLFAGDQHDDPLFYQPDCPLWSFLFSLFLHHCISLQLVFPSSHSCLWKDSKSNTACTNDLIENVFLIRKTECFIIVILWSEMHTFSTTFRSTVKYRAKHFRKYNIQCREKVIAPFLFLFLVAYLSHFKDSDHQTNCYITQR